MTSLQPTPAQGQGCTRGMWHCQYRLIDSVVKVRHGFSLIPRQLVVRYRKTPMHCLTVVWKRCRDAWGFANTLTFAFMHASSLPCLHTFGMPSLHLFTFLMFFYFLVLVGLGKLLLTCTCIYRRSGNFRLKKIIRPLNFRRSTCRRKILMAKISLSTVAFRPDIEGFRDEGFVLQRANLQIPQFLIGSVGKQVKQHMQCVWLVIKWLTTIPTWP